jgi:thiamine biosynthesis lipoprotein
MTVGAPDRVVLAALGTTAVLAVADPAALDTAQRVTTAELAAVDAACSRFRPDSEISLLLGARGSPVAVGPLLAEAVTAALRAAELTDGAVDPTVGAAVAALGYDRDFGALAPEGPTVPAPQPVPGWWRLRWDPEHRSLLVPRGVALDLGATAKALAADRIARRAAERVGCGVLVSLGGDVAAAGPAPPGGWRVGIGDDHAEALDDPDVTVTITAGGMATSGTTRRRWRRGGRTVHHIVDPRTGDIAGWPADGEG